MVHRYRHKTGLLLFLAVSLLCIALLAGAAEKGAIAVSLSPSSPNAPPEDWVVECIDCLHYFTGMSGNSAALDSSGLVHTAYGGDGLYYATQNPDDTFQIEVVDDNPYRGVNASMVLDSSDRPHILYYAGDLLRLNYAHFDGSQWQITMVPTADLTMPPNPWLVIDSNEFLHVVYNENEESVVYGRYDLNSWAFSVVDSAGAVPIGRPSLALDSGDQPHITYASGQKYGYFDGFDWQITTFSDPFTYGENAAIAFDQYNKPHIVFQANTEEGNGYDLLYRYVDENSIWQWEMIVEAGGGPLFNYVGDDITLLFDPFGQPIVTYSGWFIGPTFPYPAFQHHDLRMAYRDANGWQLLPRFNTSYTLYDTNYSTMIAGPSNHMRIVLKDGPDMKLIKLEEDGERLYYFIDRGGSTGTHNDLAVDNEDRLHMSIHEAELDHLRYALKENGAWTVQSLAYNTGFISSDWTSIALTSSGLPFVMFDFYDRPYDHLKYTYFDGQGWVFDYHLVNYNGYRFDLAMDQNNDLRVIYFPYYNNDSLFYIVRYSTDSWSAPIELDDNLVDGKFEMVLDSADFAHIAYPKEDGLGYAVETPAGWITDTITGGEIVDTALALDKDGNPHIAWYDANNQDLKYAHHDGSRWHFAAVDVVGDVGRYASLAVDNLGRVYIAYYDATNQDLKFAHFDGSVWTATTLVSEGDVGSYSSLAMPYAGYPAIAYYDAVTRDLMLVYRPFQPTSFSYTPIFPGNKE